MGVDAQSGRIDELLFDPLVRHDDHFDLKPGWLTVGKYLMRKLTFFTCIMEFASTTGSP